MTNDKDSGFTPPEKLDNKDDSEDDYIFRFQLEPDKLESVYDDPLLELVRGMLADLLDCVILTYKGKRVQIDGFRLLQDMETQYDIFPKKSLVTDEE